MERGGGYFCGLGIRSQTNSCTYINIILFVIICVRIYLFVFIQIKKGGEGEEEMHHHHHPALTIHRNRQVTTGGLRRTIGI